MKTGAKKSTPAMVEKMRELYKKGFSSVEIGKKMHRDHSTVLYWLRKRNIGRKPSSSYRKQAGAHRKPVKVCNPFSFYGQRRKEREAKKKELEERIADRLCLQCGKKKKDLKFARTNYCCLKCWGLYNSKPIVYDL